MATLLRTVLVALLVVPLPGLGQAFPSKPITLVVPYAAGGTMDALSRPLAQKMSELTGKPVIVDNRPGANSTIGAAIVAKSAPDGHTILMTSINHYIVPYLSRNVPYDTVKDFTPIIIVGVGPMIVAVHPSVPIHSVRELIEYAKANPQKLFYGTTGIGSTQHLGGLMLAQMAGIQIEHVPYKGGNPAIADVLAGAIPMAILSAPTVLTHARQGKLRALGVIESKRSRAVPDLPSIGETVRGYAVPDTWAGILGPAGVPRAVAESLNAIVRQAINAPDLKPRLEGLGFEVTGNTFDEFVAAVRSDAEVIRNVVTTAGIKPE